MSASKSLWTLHEPSGLVFPRQKPRVPAADTASGVAAKAVERTVRKSMVIERARRSGRVDMAANVGGWKRRNAISIRMTKRMTEKAGRDFELRRGWSCSSNHIDFIP